MSLGDENQMEDQADEPNETAVPDETNENPDEDVSDVQSDAGQTTVTATGEGESSAAGAEDADLLAGLDLESIGTGRGPRARHPGMRIESGPGARMPRSKRVKVARSFIRNQLVASYPDLTEEVLEQAVTAVYNRVYRTDPVVADKFVELMPYIWCPDRRNIQPLVEIHAIRQQDAIQRMEALFHSQRMGRRTDRSLHVGVFECNFLDAGRAEIRCYYNALMVKNLATAWSLGFPAGDGKKRSYTAVCKTMGNMLDADMESRLSRGSS